MQAIAALLISLLIPATIPATLLAQESNPLAGNARAVDDGRITFRGACSACHGITGQGGTGPNLVGRFTSRLSDRRLFQSIKHGVPGTDMPPFPLPDEKIWQLVSFLRSLSAPAIKVKAPGNADRGSALFFNKAGCAVCHSVAGRGGMLGPDLSNVGVTRTLMQLRESIFDPNARIEAGFAAATAVLATGGTLEGVIKNQNNYSVQLLDAKGRLHLLWRSNLRALKEPEGSLMPAGYEQTLSKTEIEDLLAFLSLRTIRPVEDVK
ncbi:MAG: c-type cytochrome [Bryobacteraceae bacterium]